MCRRASGNSTADFTEQRLLYKGRHSSVFACRDADGQPVVLKCYHKALLEKRHYRNVRREIDTMQTATEHR